MSNVINFLNGNSGALQAIFAFLIVILTGVYAYINSKMHYEMKKSREQVESPEITLRLKKVTTGFYNLVIENMSGVAAYDIEFIKFPKLPLVPLEKITTAEIGFIKNGIKYLPPKQIYDSYFLNFPSLKDKKKIIEFEIRYMNKYKKSFKQNIFINLSMFYNRQDLGKPIEEKLLNELQGINSAINKLVKHNIETGHSGTQNRT